MNTRAAFPFHVIQANTQAAEPMPVEALEDYAARLARMLPPEPLNADEQSMLEMIDAGY